MYPINVKSQLGIYLIPTHSIRNRNCIWFSLMHVKEIYALGLNKTNVFTSYGHIIELDMRKFSFINKMQVAKDLREIIIKNSSSPLTFYVEPPQGFYISENVGKGYTNIKLVYPTG